MELGFHCLGFLRYPSPFTNYFMHFCSWGFKCHWGVLFHLTMIHMHSLFNILCLRIISSIVGNYLLPRANCVGHLYRTYFRVIQSSLILLTEEYICHILSLSLTTLLVNFHNCKSEAGTLNIALFFTHNIKSKMVVFIRHRIVSI